MALDSFGRKAMFTEKNAVQRGQQAKTSKGKGSGQLGQNVSAFQDKGACTGEWMPLRDYVHEFGINYIVWWNQNKGGILI